MKEIILYPSRVKLLLYAFCSLVFVSLGVLFAVQREAMGLSLPVLIVVSYIGVPFFWRRRGLLSVSPPEAKAVCDHQSSWDS